jgi:hypothetical protein
MAQEQLKKEGERVVQMLAEVLEKAFKSTQKPSRS